MLEPLKVKVPAPYLVTLPLPPITAEMVPLNNEKEPAERVPLPVTAPLFRVKPASDWLRVPILKVPPFTVMLLPVETELFAPRARVPELMVVAPVYELLPESVTVPLPFCCKEPVPLMLLESVKLPERFRARVPLFDTLPPREPVAPPLPICRVPPVIRVPPVCEALPVRMRVLAELLSSTPFPEIVPAKVELPDPLPTESVPREMLICDVEAPAIAPTVWLPTTFNLELPEPVASKETNFPGSTFAWPVVRFPPLTTNTSPLKEELIA